MNLDTINKGDLAIDLCDKRINTYIQFKMLHYEGFKKEIQLLNLTDIIYKDNIEDDVKPFLRKLLRYEKEHEYNYSKEKGYRSVACIRLEILLPRKLNLKSDQVKFVKKFIRQINPLNFNLPVLACLVKRGSAAYIRLLISERERKGTWEVSRYNRNYFNKDKVLLHEKGSPRVDASGNIIKEYQEFSKKVRIFTFSKVKNFETFIEDLKQKMMIAIRNVLGKIEQRFTIKKKNAKKIWHFYNRKCITEINHAKQYVEMITSKALAIQREKVWDPNLIRSRPVPKASEIISTFHKYKARFEKEEFHDSNNELCKIKYKKVDLETLQKNIYRLLKEIDYELSQIVPNVCDNSWTNQKYLSYEDLNG